LLTLAQTNDENAQNGEATIDEDEDDLADDKSDVEIITERPESEMLEHNLQQSINAPDPQQVEQQGDDSVMNGQQQGFDFNAAQQGFGNMDYSAMNGFNPMMAMQNGMMGGFGMGGIPNMMGEHHLHTNLAIKIRI